MHPEWTKLLENYCRLIDARDFSGLDAVFVPDCDVYYGEVGIRGLHALREYLEGQFVRFESTRHTLGTVEALDRTVGSEGLDASGGPTGTMARIEAWHRFHPGSEKHRPDLTLLGRFESRFVETPDGWRIAEHRGSEDDRVAGS